jgi:hypothetical protein
MWLTEVEAEAKAKCAIHQRTGIGVGQPPKFDRSTSWAVF